MNKTKIIGTIGPASNSKEVFTELVKNGLRIARLNLSHGEKEYHRNNILMIREVSEELDIPVAVLLDTRGPEIRTRDFVNGQATLNEGEYVILSPEVFDGDNTKISVTYNSLHKDLKPGMRILIDDGLIELEVVEINGIELTCIVKEGGIVKNHKGINVPNMHMDLPPLSKKDEEDIAYCLDLDIEFIAASFVRNKHDLIEIKKFLSKNNAKDVQIISKIENQEGVDHLDEILDYTDAIMVARGDLGVEIPAEIIPTTQKMMIRKCNQAEIPVIIATQMLDSMIKNARPTRAEVSDVANAILDGADVVMLSGETAAGSHPIEAVKMMKKIAIETEKSREYSHRMPQTFSTDNNSVTDAVCQATVTTAKALNAKLIICPTYRGTTAKIMSIYRPDSLIVATTSQAQVQRRMQLYWGVLPLLVKKETSSEILFYKSVDLVTKMGLVEKGDRVVITSGVPLGVSGKTNLLKVEEID